MPAAADAPDRPQAAGAVSSGRGSTGEQATGEQAAGGGATDAGERVELVGRAHLRSSLQPRATWRQLIAGCLCALLGFAAVTQVRSNDEASVLNTARQSDLITILDAQSQLADRLRSELGDLQAAEREFLTNGDQQRVAVEQALERESVLGILAGTVAARGPGITLVVTDSAGDLKATRILGAVQELRNAGAEAIQVNDVRVAASTYFADDDGLTVDGQHVGSPYVIKAIGDAPTLETAMGIPGGVLDAFSADGVPATVSQQTEVVIDAIRPAETPEFAEPADS